VARIALGYQEHASLARTVLGWVPSIGFEEIVRRMVAADLALLADGDAQ